MGWKMEIGDMRYISWCLHFFLFLLLSLFISLLFLGMAVATVYYFSLSSRFLCFSFR